MLGQQRRRGSAAAAALIVAVSVALGPAQVATAQPSSGPAVKVNQVAYPPGLPKQATVVSGATSPIPWTLRNASGVSVASGQTTVGGTDTLSGDHVHIVDFSSVDTVGNGYVLSVAGADSAPFAISAEPLHQLRYDALAFFYHQRSGIPILAEHVGDRYARPAGHVNVSPNQGDDNVPCRVSCGYTMDVRGGWYDAGDHGKYGVNTGIAAWQLINQYERTVHIPGADQEALGDSTLAIPERDNGVPDILDEARWAVEFQMRMQVPTGRPDAGMVHHKVSDDQWTSLPMLPHQDPRPRVLSAVTTNATLNLAALGAQAARVWQDLDPAFASAALEAAERAYAAAKANPTRYADPDDDQGGGSYVDNDATDEFYWAAAELFVTTGASTYQNDLSSSAHFRGATINQGPIDWWFTAPLGNATLAIVPNQLPASDVSAIRNAFVGYADQVLSQSDRQGYPAPTHSSPAYRWGSNGIVANGAVLLAMAYDFTGQQRFRVGVYQALDYLFGRNPYNLSYVTGYGERAARNVHHRFWANQADSSMPTAPPGALAGGPNTDLQDPVAQEQVAGCPAQKCYVDHIDAWSVNEVAINWNAALAWVSHWAAENAGDPPPADTTPPSTPGTPTASNVTSTSAQLSWAASTDPESGVVGYDVRRIDAGGATVVASPTGTSATISELTPDTTYTFAVVAHNGEGLVSEQSGTVQVTTASTPPSSPPPSGSCQVTYTANSWNTGFTANLTVTNTSNAAWNSWTVTFGFADGQTVTQHWNSVITQSGSQVTARNASYNATVAPGASVSFGFNGAHSGTNTEPTGYAVNGAACS